MSASPANERFKLICLCLVDLYQGSTIENIDKKIDKQLPSILEQLTLPAGQISSRSLTDFKLDSVAPAENGLLEPSYKIKFDKSTLSEPRSYIDEITDLFNSLYLGDSLPIVSPNL